jgi:hypothetical protein
MMKKPAWMSDPIREAQAVLLRHLRQMPNATGERSRSLPLRQSSRLIVPHVADKAAVSIEVSGIVGLTP